MNDMEQEYDYLFHKNYPYMDTSVLKHKEVGNILNIINGGRLKHLIEFEGYGVAEYDEEDVQLNNAYVTMQDKFNRLKTNVMVFKIYNNDWSGGVYDKLFIFKTNWVKDPTLNIVMLNIETGKCIHYPEIEMAYDILAQDIMKLFNMLHRREIYDFYAMKMKAKKTNNYDPRCHEINYKDVISRYENAQWSNV